MALHLTHTESLPATLPDPGARRTLALIARPGILYDYDLDDMGFVRLTEIVRRNGKSVTADMMDLPVSVILEIAERIRINLCITSIEEAQAWERQIEAQRPVIPTGNVVAYEGVA